MLFLQPRYIKYLGSRNKTLAVLAREEEEAFKSKMK